MSGSEDDEPMCPCKKKTQPNCILIECAECETAYHPACCGLDGISKHIIGKIMIKKWRCPRCFTFPDDIPTPTQKKETTKLSRQTVSEIITIVNSTVEENLKTLLSSDNLEQTDENDEAFTLVNRRNRHNSIQSAIKEQREEEIRIEQKKDNLIIYGMPEIDSVDKREEMLEDFRRIQKVYEGKTEVKNEDLKHMTRLGRKETGKVRPIQIVLADQNKRKELLTKNSNLKLLENETSTNIYVSTDRTKLQRKADKALRDELKQRRQTNPDLVIRNNRIVQFRAAAQDSPSWASLFN